MADITYTRTFTHDDWIDNKDVVEASGERGFNTKFHALESEFDTIGTVVGSINTALKGVQRLNFVQSQNMNVPANGTSAELALETYDRALLPPNVDKVYYAAIFPVSGSTNIRHTILYRQALGTKIAVSIVFFNSDTVNAAVFSFRVMTLAAQL